MNATTTHRSVPTRVNVPTFVVGTVLAAASLGASSQATELHRQLGEVRDYLESTASNTRGRRREQFNRLARQWRGDTQWLSSTTDIAMHPAYQAIIGMGPEALPMIVKELRDNSGHWYWALKAISNEDPVPPSDRGAIKRMKNAWLHWAEQKGIIDKW